MPASGAPRVGRKRSTSTMPTYEYQCPACGVFEYIQTIREEALTTCPKCNAPVERIISGGTGFVLKGRGWSNPFPTYDDND
jgi:putative FmdB family regulatory protein